MTRHRALQGPTDAVDAGGRSSAFDLSFESSCGETADYEFSTEMAVEIHPRA